MTYTIHNCIVEMSSGMQTAKVRRLEIMSADGKKVLQSAAEMEFETKVENIDGKDVTISAQEQATLWARALPDVIDDEHTDVDEGSNG